MAESSTQEPKPEIKRRGANRAGIETRKRIIDVAGELMYVRGVNATTIDDITVAGKFSKSQIYRNFADKTALTHAVVDLRATQVLEREGKRLGKLNSFAGLDRWRNAVVHNNASVRGAYGCGLGAMAIELADSDEEARVSLDKALGEWQLLLASGFGRMRDSGVLRPDADPTALATGLMAALQGGYLLAQAAHDSAPMAIALDMAIDHVKSFAAA